MFQDKILVCKDCGSEFVFTARDQEFFAEKGFTNEPPAAKTAVWLAKMRRQQIQ
jgi:N-acetylglutamate synthase-like GNAT family acetyltransferase